jgi:hypothetical protein
MKTIIKSSVGGIGLSVLDLHSREMRKNNINLERVFNYFTMQ